MDLSPFLHLALALVVTAYNVPEPFATQARYVVPDVPAVAMAVAEAATTTTARVARRAAERPERRSIHRT
jgi:hypothetical protein